MSIERQFIFWLGAAVLLALFLWALSAVMLPFAAGLALAYLLDPLATRLQKLGASRLFASLFIIGLGGVVIVVALVALAPTLVAQAGQFIERLPAYATKLQALITQHGSDLFARAKPALDFLGVGPTPEGAESNLPAAGDLVGQGARWAGTLLGSLWQGGQAILGLVSLLVITPVVAFYLLLDWPRLVAGLDDLAPTKHREVVRGLAREMDSAMSGFIRGQSLVCLFLGLWYGIGFTLAGLHFGLLIGIIAGVLSFIPYVGSLTGLILSVGVALVQGPWSLLGVVLAIQFAGQFIEGNILTPRFVGEAVGLHPVWIMFALLAAGSLAGFTGLILAVPLAAVIGVLARFGVRQYVASPLYQIEAGSRPNPDSKP
jgi:predicted PurR-regulated permease PerM